MNSVVICLKNRTFVVSTTTVRNTRHSPACCDLLEKSYLCGVNNNVQYYLHNHQYVVICLKNRTFVVSTTTQACVVIIPPLLWFAWKIVPLWCQQQRAGNDKPQRRSCDLLEKSYLCGVNNNFPVNPCSSFICCDLLEKSYLCGVNNNWHHNQENSRVVVICLKNRTFVVSTTTIFINSIRDRKLWFAWKIVPLWCQQQLMYKL